MKHFERKREKGNPSKLFGGIPAGTYKIECNGDNLKTRYVTLNEEKNYILITPVKEVENV